MSFFSKHVMLMLKNVPVKICFASQWETGTFSSTFVHFWCLKHHLRYRAYCMKSCSIHKKSPSTWQKVQEYVQTFFRLYVILLWFRAWLSNINFTIEKTITKCKLTVSDAPVTTSMTTLLLTAAAEKPVTSFNKKTWQHFTRPANEVLHLSFWPKQDRYMNNWTLQK